MLTISLIAFCLFALIFAFLPTRVHSLPGASKELELRAYEMCDSMWGSDHRPVAMAINLDLKRAQRRKRRLSRLLFTPSPSTSSISPQDLPPATTDIVPGLTPDDDLVFYFRLSDIDFDLTPAPAPFALSAAGSSYISNGSYSTDDPESFEDGPPVAPSFTKQESSTNAHMTTKIVVLFPLTPERPSTRMIELLDSAFFPHQSRWSQQHSQLLEGLFSLSWDDSMPPSEKVMDIAAAVPGPFKGGALHTLIRLQNSRGSPLGQVRFRLGG